MSRLFVGLFLVVNVYATQVFAQADGHARFLKLEGDSQLSSGALTIQELEKVFIEPLRQNPKIALFSYVVQTQGAGHFFFHFIAQATSPENFDEFNLYIRKIEAQKFQNIEVKFHDVAQMYELANVQVGNYIDKEDDPFGVSFQVLRKFDFVNLSEWQNFTDAYGTALLSKDHSAFQKYLMEFISDPIEIKKLAVALSRGNMMAIDPRVFLVLTDGSIVDGELENSPIIPFRFFRNCYELKYEHGNCF